MKKAVILFLVLSAVAAWYFTSYKNIPLPKESQFQDNPWKVDEMFHGRTVMPFTENEIVFPEAIWFYKNRVAQVPGFRSRGAKGKWELKDDSLTISDLDTLSDVYEGTYKLEVDTVHCTLKLVSIKTRMTCSDYMKK